MIRISPASLSLMFLMLCALGAYGDDEYEFNLHLLLISNGNYSSAERIDGAFASVMMVKAELERRFDVSSVTILRSDEERLISKDDVFDVVSSFRNKLTQTDFLFVYYIGHGYGEGIAWNYFLQPGNLSLPKQLNHFDVEVIAEQAIYLGYLNDELLKLDAPYSLMIDSCYEGELVDASIPILSKTAEDNIRDTVGVLKYLNEFHTNNPIVLSAAPGDFVFTVKHPYEAQLPYTIGPLARRLTLSLRKADLEQRHELSNIVRLLKSSDLDVSTNPAICNARVNESIRFPKSKRMLKSDMIQLLYGTAKSGNSTFLDISVENAEETQASHIGPEVVSGSAAILGVPGEYVSDGKNHVFTHGIDVFSVSYIDKGELEITVNESGEAWSFAIAAPEGKRLQKRSYTDIARYPFQEGRQAGFSVSGDGRICNKISGSLTIDEIEYEEGLPKFLSLDFEQLCEEERRSLKGSMIIELKY